MRRLASCLVLVLVLASCESNQPPSTTTGQLGTVAIVDLDEVARRLGRDVEMANSIRQREQTLKEQLAAVQTSFNQQLQARQQQLGPEATTAEQQGLLEFQRTANVRFNEVRQEAADELREHRKLVIQRFHEQARPIALAVAAEAGLSVVLTKHSGVFAFQEGVDITDEVIVAMLKQYPAAKPAARTAKTPGEEPRR